MTCTLKILPRAEWLPFVSEYATEHTFGVYGFICFFVWVLNGATRLWHDRNYGDVMAFCVLCVLYLAGDSWVFTRNIHSLTHTSRVKARKQDVLLFFRVCRKGDENDEERKLLRQTAKGKWGTLLWGPLPEKGTTLMYCCCFSTKS